MNDIIKIVTFAPRKIYGLAKGVNKWVTGATQIGEKFSSFEMWCTRVFGSTSAGTLFGKGAADAAIAYACEDGVCFVISLIGCSADALQFIANFVPGPNVTVILTLPVSAGCKTFVWACKNQTLPWKGGCD